MAAELDHTGQLAQLQAQLAAQQKTIDALIDRLERTSIASSGVYTLFEQNTLLQQTIARRTRELEDSNVQLRASEERFRRLVEASPDFILTLDQSARIVFINRTDAALRVDEVLGRPAVDFAHPEHRLALTGVIEEVYTQGEPGELEFQLITGRWYLLRMMPIVEVGRTTQVVAIATDITERRLDEERRRKLESQLHQSQKMEAIGTLAGGIAHDFNNILYAIIGYAEIVQEGLPAGSALRADQAEVIRAAKRAAELVRRILSFSRQSTVEAAPLELAPLVAEVLRLARASLPSTIRIDPQLDAPRMMVLTHPTDVHQILLNLCSNAGQAMDRGGTLELRLQRAEFGLGDVRGASAPGGYACITVRDTGCGMSPEVRERIFDPFFTTKGVGQGTGLGLSTVHGIVTRLGGFIEVDSTPGAGTTFRVYLPCVEAPQPSAAAAAPAAGGSGRVLFVDDEESLVRVGCGMLRRLGYNPEGFTSSTAALAEFERDPGAWAAVVTDQTMPELTGIDMARRLLSVRPDLPILLCTGYSQLVTEESALAAGVAAFLHKPATMHDLAAALQRALAASQAASARPIAGVNVGARRTP